jgi:hypothetical protein
MIYVFASLQFFFATIKLHPRLVVPLPYVVQMSAGVSVFVEFALHRRFRTKFDVAKVLLLFLLAVLNHDEPVESLLKDLIFWTLTCLLHCVFFFQDLTMIRNLKDPERSEHIVATVEAVIVAIFRMTQWLHACIYKHIIRQAPSKPLTTASFPPVTTSTSSVHPRRVFHEPKVSISLTRPT